MVNCLRILALSDIHQRVHTLQDLLEKAGVQNIDLIIVAGDFTNYGDEHDVLEIMERLNFAKIFAVPGNLDSESVLNTLEKRKVSLHNKCTEFKGFKFCGFGGGIIGSAGPLVYSELEIEERLKKLVKPGTVLVTHVPPKGTKLDVTSGEHNGSVALRNVILEKRPLLNICGHTHEAHGKTTLGSTTCINVAAVKEGRAWIIELGKKIYAKRVTI